MTHCELNQIVNMESAARNILQVCSDMKDARCLGRDAKVGEQLLRLSISRKRIEEAIDTLNTDEDITPAEKGILAARADARAIENERFFYSDSMQAEAVAAVLQRVTDKDWNYRELASGGWEVYQSEDGGVLIFDMCKTCAKEQNVCDCE